MAQLFSLGDYTPLYFMTPKDTLKLISDTKQHASSLSGDAKKKYLSGVRAGMDLSALMAGDTGSNLAGDKDFQGFLDYLDAEV